MRWYGLYDLAQVMDQWRALVNTAIKWWERLEELHNWWRVEKGSGLRIAYVHNSLPWAAQPVLS
jgi:hypothetical protein